jgi:hypothetical protein
VARGWESKSVESQQAEAEERVLRLPSLTPEEAERKARKESLLLQRSRLLREIQSACHPRFRGQLEAALAHLDGELAKLG